MQKDVLSIANDIISQTQSLITLAKELVDIGENLEERFKELKKSFEPKEDAPEKEYTMVNVRAVLAEKSAKGYSKEVKALLEKNGADRLSALSPELYKKVIEGAMNIGND